MSPALQLETEVRFKPKSGPGVDQDIKTLQNLFHIGRRPLLNPNAILSSRLAGQGYRCLYDAYRQLVFFLVHSRSLILAL